MNRTHPIRSALLAGTAAAVAMLSPALQAQAWIPSELSTVLARADRPADDRARDEARRPSEIVAFAGVEPGMTVLDVMAAGGWYTEVLSVAVGDEGTVYAENPRWLLDARDGASDRALSERLGDGRLANVVRVDEGLAQGRIDPGSVDVALSALNFHDTYYLVGPEAAARQLEQVYTALKPGGVFVLVDHVGAPRNDNARLHRIPPGVVLEMAAAAGFEVVAEGDMLANPRDDLTEMVFAPEIRGRTDRFVLKLRKPA